MGRGIVPIIQSLNEKAVQEVDMLKVHYYHFLDADNADDADLRIKNPRYPRYPRLKNYRLIELPENQSI